MPTNDRKPKAVDQRDSSVDQRVRDLVAAAETFVVRFGAQLCEWQATMRPVEFARLVDTLGIGRAKVDRLMAAARLADAEVDETRPSAWWILFRRIEPAPLLPGEARPLVDAALAVAEPAQYRRRADLLSADGLALQLIALHEPNAISPQVLRRLASWLEAGEGRDEALNELRSWRTLFDSAGHGTPASATGGAQQTAEEATQ